MLLFFWFDLFLEARAGILEKNLLNQLIFSLMVYWKILWNHKRIKFVATSDQLWSHCACIAKLWNYIALVHCEWLDFVHFLIHFSWEIVLILYYLKRKCRKRTLKATSFARIICCWIGIRMMLSSAKSSLAAPSFSFGTIFTAVHIQLSTTSATYPKYVGMWNAHKNVYN